VILVKWLSLQTVEPLLMSPSWFTIETSGSALICRNRKREGRDLAE
jgi:hypothetical protein